MAGGSLKKLLMAGTGAGALGSLYNKGIIKKQRFLVWLDPNKDPLDAGYSYIIQSLA